MSLNAWMRSDRSRAGTCIQYVFHVGIRMCQKTIASNQTLSYIRPRNLMQRILHTVHLFTNAGAKCVSQFTDLRVSLVLLPPYQNIATFSYKSRYTII